MRFLQYAKQPKILELINHLSYNEYEQEERLVIRGKKPSIRRRKCPKCGRAFRNLNQSHYCGKAPTTVDEYTAIPRPADTGRYRITDETEERTHE